MYISWQIQTILYICVCVCVHVYVCDSWNNVTLYKCKMIHSACIQFN